MNIADAKRNVRTWIGSGRYINQRALEPFFGLAGIVLHDDGDELYDAMRSYRVEVKPLEFGTRFKAWAVYRDQHHVALIGTGMGATNSAILIHELGAALQSRGLNDRVPIIKVGTCPSTWSSLRAGTVLIPMGAINDEGVTHWTEAKTDVRPKKWFAGRKFVKASDSLTKRWHQHVAHAMRPVTINSLVANKKPSLAIAIWSADAIFPVMWHSKFYRKLAAMEPVIHLSSRGSVKLDRNSKVVSDNAYAVAGWDMECSALFSAAISMEVSVSAGLVVSYTAEQCANIGNTGDSRRSACEKQLVHEREDKLVIEAVDFLFRSA